MASDVEVSYSRRAAEYTERLGSVATVRPSDLHLVTSWAAEVEGPLLDAGCGPGHWTGYLAEHGNDARGIDQVPAFIEHARRAHPGVPFEVGSIDALPDSSGSIGGVLAWYSLIHHEPALIRQPLAEFARVLRPGGKLLVGFFAGPKVERFDHAITTAYTWPPETMAADLRAAGFEIIETHTRTGALPKPRPHGAILAHLSDDR
ncbi:class I SAM-dependent methyltransferase [Agreia pratensis]|uniref:class I SAM-dependent methyltransferase n=1 Tax=Microbacteriaceae TaxID=85023 RepID=UPI00188B3E8E|nr:MULTISPECIES: class I SAM-dependent methyltransferase [Microbacteriaceae]MBF4561249.1 class I SAM-dependent methyltransferase [Microbacterium sp. VKM Ac-2870]MBF4633862.1 class I SAM-dependent methyltransferase [Agreia pratensis]